MSQALTQLGTLEAGQEFEMGGQDWLVLEHNKARASTLVVMKECLEDRAFDENNSNDFRNSTLRKYLNNDFIEELVEEGMNKDDIVLTDFDLSNSKGENIYGYCRDMVGLLTQEQYKEHRDILTLDDYWWLVSPGSSSSHFVRRVHTSGTLSHSHAYFGLVGVRPALNVKSGIFVTIESEYPLSEYSTKELLEELLRREE